ncbi:MAG: DUF1772 domain-containing protein [Citrobacter freundii]|nr:MAG: DUF1772 domain-containing protein [Citrobacter freundii]
MTTILLLIATTATALIAGLFYAYSCSVNPGLGRLADKSYLDAMQSINRAILNPLFFVSFIGALLLLPAGAVVMYGQSRECFVLLFAAAAVYVIGSFGVTMFGNVPLNNMLDRFDLINAAASDLAAMRNDFEKPWNRLHSVRTFFSVISLLLVITACIKFCAKQA